MCVKTIPLDHKKEVPKPNKDNRTTESLRANQTIPFTVLFYPNEILLGPSEIIIYQSEFEFYLSKI